jgi:hypothetical protein
MKQKTNIMSQFHAIITVAGLLARSQYPEGPVTGRLGTGFLCYPVSKKVNAEMVPKAPSCYSMLLM